MNERRTIAILQRLPVILAVTAASYGLNLAPAASRSGSQGISSTSAPGQPPDRAPPKTTQA